VESGAVTFGGDFAGPGTPNPNTFMLKGRVPSDPNAGAKFRMMRRHNRAWSEVAVFGSFADAADALDKALGRGEGTAADFRLEEAGDRPQGWRKVLRLAAWAVFAAIALAVIAFWAAMFLS
jgi:hypothetical protein